MLIRSSRLLLAVVLQLTAARTLAQVPTVVTSAATSVTTSSAALNGSANPNGASTTGWFRIATTSPGACNDTFGTRVPATGGTDLGAGSAQVAYSITATGLAPSTTYYFCAIAGNASGTDVGTVLSLLVTGPPAATTSAATLVTSSSATLSGSGSPNGDATYGYFRYSTTSPGTCSDTFGTRAPSSSGSDSYLGAGTSAVAYSRPQSNLTPATTYYFCALARNAWGTSFGAILSFTTLAALPTATSISATLLTGTTAQLNGSSNPGGAATTGWFRFATTSPGTCNDSFGTRAPATGGSSLGSGTTSLAYSQGISGLTAGTTYYACAIAQNSVGISFGSVITFVTPLPPAVTTSAASSLTSSTAYLNGSATPNGSATSGYFRYSTTNPGTCNDTFGSRAPTSGGTGLGSGTGAGAYAQAVTGLSAATTYYFCAIATNAEGTAFGSVLSFTTSGPPATATAAATLMTSSSATLNGSSTPNGDYAYGWFRYSTSNPGICNDTFGTRVPASSASDIYLGSGISPVAFSWSIAGLTPGTTYYTCALGRNSYGTSVGAIFAFTTLAALPTVSTGAATSLTVTSATLNGTANPGGAATTGWFRYHTTSPGTCNDTFGIRAPASGGSSLGSGATGVAYSQGITGLTPGTTYYACAIAQNSAGTTVGSVLSFTTPAAPTVNSLAATPVTATTATLNASVNPNGSASTGWFRYATTSPGTCNDTFGTRSPVSSASDVALGSGTFLVALIRPVTGLSPATTYYFCALASSAYGTSFGAVLSFTTPAAPPSVTTGAATLLTGNTAQLNASAIPNGSEATGWFRYATTSPGACNDTFGTRAPTSGGVSLGGGTSSVAWSQPVAGLSAGTTYYVCAIVSSGIGTSVGSVASFTTLASPTVSTAAATSITSSSATLNGTGIPNNDATIGWFRYATTSPGTCNDSFGTRAPAAAGSALGSGTSAVAFSQAIAGLVPGATYYYCAIASNSVGTAFGGVLSFTTLAVPPVTTTAVATSVSSSSATLNGSANPGGADTNAWFRYSTTSPGVCDDSFGTRAPASGGTALGSGTGAVAYSQALAGLTPGTTYYYCAIASNSVGTAVGAVQNVTTLAVLPVTTTSPATLVTSSSATVNGSANPGGASTTGWFRYSISNPGSCNDTFGTRVPASGGTALGSGTSAVAFSQAITGLAPDMLYYYCPIASNSVGTAFGTLQNFIMLGVPPVTTTTAATSVSSSAAALNGSANPSGHSATGWFRYSTASPGTCNDTFGTRAPTSGGTSLGGGASAVAYSQAIAGLAPVTTYYYCAIASNGVGTTFGAVQTFTTPALPPIATTVTATSVLSSSATLNGSANPGGADTNGWFRYSTASPGVCDDSFGTRAPASGGTALGSGMGALAYSQAIAGLAPGTTYYYCALASNSVGTAFGAVQTFTTLAVTPAATTAAATSVSSSAATLNGSANPGGASTTGYFRYAQSNPGACDDSFGTRAPAAGGSALGSGMSSIPFSEDVTGLAAGTAYYYCAIASNAVGTSFGAMGSFTTSGAPAVTTEAATAVTSVGATLNGLAVPSGAETSGWFRIDTADPGACNDSFGTRAPAAGGLALGAGTSSAAFSQDVTGLAPGTTYYYCAIAENALGKRSGDLLSLTTGAAPPSVTTAAPTGVTNDSAVLNGSAVPNGNASIGWFRYATVGPGACDDAFGTRTPSTGGTPLGAGTQPAAFTAALAGLTRGAVYYYCAIAGNAEGTSFGTIQVAVPGTTSPVVTTEATGAISGSGATLAGTANPNGNSATGWFRYGDVAPISCDDSFGTRAPVTGGTSLGAGMSPLPFEQPIAGLEPNLTYYYCAAASNLGGATFGEVHSFITDPLPPVVATLTATVGANGAITLEGLANPRGTETTTWFRFSTAAPGSCDDTFGRRWPEVGGTAVGAGRANVHYSEVTELPPGKYFACAIGSNVAGPGFGDLVTFTIPQPSSSGGGGCGCRTGSLSGSDATPVLALLALLLFSSTRRMRNRAKRPGSASCCEVKS